jgi:hypothetical protein
VSSSISTTTPQHFTFGSGATAGSFDFFVNDLSITAGRTGAVSGTILPTAAVPEPATYALFLAGSLRWASWHSGARMTVWSARMLV